MKPRFVDKPQPKEREPLLGGMGGDQGLGIGFGDVGRGGGGHLGVEFEQFSANSNIPDADLIQGLQLKP